MIHDMDQTSHPCCDTDKADNLADAHAHHGGHNSSALKTAAHATLHCLTGCMIGELIGLMIGVTLGFHPYTSMALSTVLAFISGFSLTVFPLMHRAKFGFSSAFKAIWLGELLSIGVMELVMNSIDYHMGGVRTGSVFNPLFWEALAVA
ncbi:MAG: DUF4396 domain-containing protein, partial [Gammaproteobacteria bacterium]